jgi:hypothetical protein
MVTSVWEDGVVQLKHGALLRGAGSGWLTMPFGGSCAPATLSLGLARVPLSPSDSRRIFPSPVGAECSGRDSGLPRGMRCIWTPRSDRWRPTGVPTACFDMRVKSWTRAVDVPNDWRGSLVAMAGSPKITADSRGSSSFRCLAFLWPGGMHSRRTEAERKWVSVNQNGPRDCRIFPTWTRGVLQPTGGTGGLLPSHYPHSRGGVARGHVELLRMPVLLHGAFTGSASRGPTHSGGLSCGSVTDHPITQGDFVVSSLPYELSGVTNLQPSNTGAQPQSHEIRLKAF